MQDVYELFNECFPVIKEWHDTKKDPHYIGVELQVALAYTNKSYRELLDGDVHDFVNRILRLG